MNPEQIESVFLAFRQGVYKKNIVYPHFHGAKAEEFVLAGQLGGAPAQVAWITQQAHYQEGVQMQVAPNVTADLVVSDFSNVAKVENIPWPALVVEVYFQDPLLPTILVMKYTTKQLAKQFPQIKIIDSDGEFISAVMLRGSGTIAELLSLNVPDHMYDNFLATGITRTMDLGPFSSSLDKTDNYVMAYMLHLTLKVFAFASIPQYKPVAMTRKQMVLGGKPEVKGRPLRPAFHVTYMPKVIPLGKPTASPSEEHREFHGRRGFIRWYHSEKFVNRRGTWDFIAPVADPRTGKYPEHSIIKVRKP